MSDFSTKGRIELNGFEDALIAYWSENFRFSGGFLSNIKLRVGRHLFVQDMRNTDELVADAQAEADAAGEPMTYDPEREPCIAVFTSGTQGLAPAQGRGGRHEWTLRVVMRLGVIMEECKARLEELAEYLNDGFRGASIDGFAIKGAIMQTRPNSFQIEDSDQAYCEVQLRLFAVPRVTR